MIRHKDEIKVNALQLSITKVAVYVLVGLIILAAAYFLLYDGLMYYMFQLFLGLAYFLRFIILFAAVVSLIFLFDYIEKKIFGNQLRISFGDQSLELSTEKHNYQIPYDQLKSITLTKKNDTYSALEIHTDKSLNFSLGSWTDNVKDPQFGSFWNAFKKVLQQKDFHYNADSGKQNKTTVVREMLCLNYDDYLRKKKRNKRRIFIFLAFYFLFVIAVVLYLVPKFSSDGISIRNGEKIGSSYFERYQNQVYFLKISDGYFPVTGANHQSFRSLQTEGEIFSKVGADNKNVYWEDQKLALLDPASSVYLGGNYTKDTRNVYFRDQLMKNIDVATFQSVRHSQYNTPVYNFGKDRSTVFYKTFPLPGLQPATAQSFDNSSRYIKDRQSVFYKSTLLTGLNASRTKVYDSEDYRAAYATDGQHHYLNERPVPTTASNKYFGSTAIDLSTFKLLIAPGAGSYLYLFGDARHLYFYDENRGELVMIYKFNQPVALRPLEDGRFTDGKATYTLNVRKIISRARTSQSTRGHQSEILRIEGSKEPVRLASYASTQVEWKAPE